MNEDAAKILKKVQIENIILGIGDVAEATGVSQSQLRYWESKGYIHSQVAPNHKIRKFSYKTLIDVKQIKTFLDDGYTLAGAVKQTEQRGEYLETLWSFFESRFQSINIEEDAAKIDMGVFDPDPTKHLRAERQDGTWKFKLVDA